MDLGTRDQVDFLGTNVGNNWRVIRYADVLLMLAEALNEDGMTSQAIPHIDEVRNRAGLTNIVSNITKQELLDERRAELAFENQFDQVIVNDNLVLAFEELKEVVEEFIKS